MYKTNMKVSFSVLMVMEENKWAVERLCKIHKKPEFDAKVSLEVKHTNCLERLVSHNDSFKTNYTLKKSTFLKLLNDNIFENFSKHQGSMDILHILYKLFNGVSVSEIDLWIGGQVEAEDKGLCGSV